MRNKIKCLLINLLLLAGVYCSWGCSCCADCCNKCCGKKDLYFKIKGEAINNNDLGCFGKSWFETYKEKKDDNNNAILLYKLTEQKNKQEKEAGTLVYSKESEELKYTSDVDFQKDLKGSGNKWAIFKVTTLNEDKKGDSHIFYCSDVSSFHNGGLFEKIECWSVEILAANTKKVENFSFMFKETNSYLERYVTDHKKSGFIGLEKLDVSSAKFLSYMFYMALFKQKTIDSLRTWHLQGDTDISYMFSVDISKFLGPNGPDFSVLNGWIEENSGRLKYVYGYKYNIFFKGDDDAKNNDKLPEWYADRIK